MGMCVAEWVWDVDRDNRSQRRHRSVQLPNLCVISKRLWDMARECGHAKIIIRRRVRRVSHDSMTMYSWLVDTSSA